MSTLQEKLNSITAKEPSKWLENAQWRANNAGWLDKSAKIAFKILRELRAKKISQKDFAMQLGLSPQYVNKVVKGQENLTLETISKMEEVLGICLVHIPGFSGLNLKVQATTGNIGSVNKQVVKTESKKYLYQPGQYQPETEIAFINEQEVAYGN
jgi:transcriptional regulator with XRE-family HTH domain